MRMAIPTNYYGQVIVTPYQLASPDFGTGDMDKYGIPIIDWPRFTAEHADNCGFDKRNIEANGQYTISYVLPKDTVIIRFGSEHGQYTAPQNTRFEEVSLPYTIESVEYHEYRVIADGLHVQCIVDKGKAAPMFHQPGGGVQYRHQHSIRSLIRDAQLERIK